MIALSLERAEQVEQDLLEKRSSYSPIAVRGSLMYFVIASLASVDPMYQNSLTYVKKLTNETILKQLAFLEAREEMHRGQGRTLERDIVSLRQVLIDQITMTLFTNIC